MDSDEAGMQELSNDASFISLLCDAGCSERPTVSTILEISMLIALISFCITLCVGVHGHQMSNFKSTMTILSKLYHFAWLENTVKTHVLKCKIIYRASEVSE